MPATNSNVDYNKAINMAARAWNTANTGVTFGRLVLTSCSKLLPKANRVTVKIFTGPNTTKNDKCREGIACVRIIDNSQYPHLTEQELLIRVPPQPGDKWSSNESGKPALMPNEIYLPSVMTHEFGHAGGLRHSTDSSDIMHTGWDHKKVGHAPQPGDVSAMKSIYKNHSSH